MSIADTATACNPLELEAQAYEHAAEALQLYARAARLRMATATTATPAPPAAAEHMTRADYARRSRVSEATVSRWLKEGMPSIPVGTSVRLDPVEADAWRRARGMRPTKAAIKASPELDVGDVLQGAGLRLVQAGSSR